MTEELDPTEERIKAYEQYATLTNMPKDVLGLPMHRDWYRPNHFQIYSEPLDRTLLRSLIGKASDDVD